MKNEKFFSQDRDVRVISSLQSNPAVLIQGSSTAAFIYAGSANAFAATLFSSGSSGTISAYDSYGSPTNVSVTGLFQQISAFFFGRSDGVIPYSNDPTYTTTTVRTVFINRPSLDEGLKSNSITAAFSNAGTANTISLTAIDMPLTSSVNNLKLGRIGALVIAGATADRVGTVFYDFGLMVFHGSRNSATANMFISNTGANTNFGWGRALSSDKTSVSGTTARLNINYFNYQTHKTIIRNLYFCRLFNDEFNYSSNPTSKKPNGELLDTLLEAPSVYVSTVALYNNNDEILAVGKINPPVRKHVGKEHTFIVSLDFLLAIGFSLLSAALYLKDLI